jgi:hypothetical protein
LTIEAQSGIIYNMENEENGMEWDEGSDVDNWETEQVFQDHEGEEDEGDYTPEPREDFGYFGEMGMMED